MAGILSVDFQNCLMFVLACLFLFYFFFKKPKDGFHLPPSPPSLPFIGHLHLLSVSVHESLRKISSKYGPLVHLRILNIPIVLVSSASVAYEIFRTQDVNISSRGAIGIDKLLMFAPSGFFNAPYGNDLKFMKKFIASKWLGPQALEWSRGVRAVELERFYRKLLDKAMRKESVGIIEEALRFVNNNLCKMSMGGSILEENKEVDRVMKLSADFFALANKISSIQMLRQPLKKLAVLLFKKQIMDVSRRIDELLDRVIVEREDKLDEYQGNDLLAILLGAYRDENAEYKITMANIKSSFAELCLAAPDSSATSIQWTMTEIINHPSILKILREEIESVVGKTRLIQETDLPNLPYLQAVVKEGLRLHPHTPVLVREFKEGCNVRGFYIPGDTKLFVNAYAVMRDPDSWEDPDEFKPQRFLEEDKKEKTLKYLPFGSGRRGCPGTNLGYIFVGTAIGMMVQCFDWEITGDKINTEESKGKIFLKMAHPLKCTPLPRTLNPLSSNLQIPSL